MTERDLDGRTAARQRRWRRLSRIVSGALGVAAVGVAVQLGVTGPSVSPVQPVPAPTAAPATAAPAAPTQPDARADDDGAAARGDDGRGGDRGARFDPGRRR